MTACKNSAIYTNGDSRSPLPPNTIIKDEIGICYKIKAEEIEFGGSALLYRVERTGSLRNFILKECYPRSRDLFFSRKNGIVYADDEKSEEVFKILKTNMRRENVTGQLISRKTGRTISAFENLNAVEIIIDGETFAAKDSCFLVMEQATDGENRGWFLKDFFKECEKPIEPGAPFRNGGLPAPIFAAQIIEELLKSLRDIHNAGYIHGDISDLNIFFMGNDLQNGDVGVGQLLDFGNSFKLQADGKTAPIENVFTTEGYSAPEIFQSTDSIRLTPAADIFSCGALMLYLLKGMRYRKACGKDLTSSFKVKTFVTEKKLLKRGYNREAAILFIKILSKALNFNPENRYQNAAEMLKEIIFLKKIIASPKFTLSRNLSKSPYFVNGSRDKELAALQQEINIGTHPLYIWGIGGVGKTELAMEFARKQIENGRASYLVTFKNSMKETVMAMNFSGWNYEFDGNGNAADREYRARLDLLKENYKDSLLIIDNFDSTEKSISELQSEAEYKDILSLDMKILFTTRSRPNDSTPELNPLTEENALSLFKSIVKFQDKEKNIVLKLIQEVDCHPMTVEILARTLKAAWGTLTAKDLLLRLRSENINSEKFPKVAHQKGISEREAKIYGHLRTLFNLIYFDKVYREILCDLTLLPVEGFDAAEFILSETSFKKKQLKTLESGGWIRRKEENNTLWIHPLIRSVLKNELKPTNEDCQFFLHNLWARLDDRYPLNRELFLQAGEIYERATKDFGDLTGENNFHAGYCYIIGENFVKALLYDKAAAKIFEENEKQNDVQIARIYNDTGVASFFLQDYDTGMEYLQKALKVLEDNAPEDSNAANIFSNIGNAFMMLGDYEKAVELTGRAVKIFEKNPPKNKHEKANAHRTFAMALIWVKKYNEAMKNFFAAAEILNELTPEGSADIAQIYSSIGETYALQGDKDSALSYLLKSLSLQDEFLPKNHNDKIFSYNLIAKVYEMSGNESEGKKFRDMAARAIKENKEQSLKKLLETNLDFLEMHGETLNESQFIRRFQEVANCYRQLEDFKNAQNFISKAIEKISSATDPLESSQTYFTASDIYFDTKNFEEALKFAQKSLDIVKNSETENYSNLSTNYMHVGNLSYSAGKLADTVENYRLAEQFQLKCKHPDFDMIRFLQFKIANVLTELKNFDEAEKIFAKLLADSLKLYPENHSEVIKIKSLLQEVRRQKEN